MSEFTHRLPHQPWSKPSRNEEEYFRRKEFRDRMERAREKETRRAEDERQELMARHGDRCPACGSALEAMETPAGRADQCPNCLGVWMDHETFDALTHPERENEFLANIFRANLLQFTTGKLHPLDEQGDER